MNTANAALVFGVVFIVVGLSGFFPAPPPLGAPPLAFDHGHGLALGIFPVNTVHNIVHLLFGVLGIAASRGALMAARGYFQLVTVAYTALAVLGLIPATQTTFGLVPIWGADVWLHAAIAVVAAYFGFAARIPTMQRVCRGNDLPKPTGCGGGPRRRTGRGGLRARASGAELAERVPLGLEHRNQPPHGLPGVASIRVGILVVAVVDDDDVTR